MDLKKLLFNYINKLFY